MPGPEHDRRLHPRTQVRVPLYIAMEDRVFNKMVPLHSADVSAGGLAFETHHRVPVEGRIRLVVSCLGELPSSAHIEGRVVYVEAIAGSERFRVGVEFSMFVHVDPERLLERIRECESAAVPAAQS